MSQPQPHEDLEELKGQHDISKGKDTSSFVDTKSIQDLLTLLDIEGEGSKEKIQKQIQELKAQFPNYQAAYEERDQALLLKIEEELINRKKALKRILLHQPGNFDITLLINQIKLNLKDIQNKLIVCRAFPEKDGWYVYNMEPTLFNFLTQKQKVEHVKILRKSGIGNDREQLDQLKEAEKEYKEDQEACFNHLKHDLKLFYRSLWQLYVFSPAGSSKSYFENKRNEIDEEFIKKNKLDVRKLPDFMFERIINELETEIRKNTAKGMMRENEIPLLLAKLGEKDPDKKVKTLEDLYRYFIFGLKERDFEILKDVSLQRKYRPSEYDYYSDFQQSYIDAKKQNKSREEIKYYEEAVNLFRKYFISFRAYQEEKTIEGIKSLREKLKLIK